MMCGSIDKQFKEKDIAGRGYVNTGNGVVTEFYAPYGDPGYDFFTELSRIYEERQQEGEAYDLSLIHIFSFKSFSLRNLFVL